VDLSHFQLTQLQKGHHNQFGNPHRRHSVVIVDSDGHGCHGRFITNGGNMLSPLFWSFFLGITVLELNAAVITSILLSGSINFDQALKILQLLSVYNIIWQ
jgi:hypothetical protein